MLVIPHFKTAVASVVIALMKEKKNFSAFRKLGIEPDYFTVSRFEKVDIKRIKESNRKASEADKK